MRNLLFIVLIITTFISCNNNSSIVTFDLIEYGLPITINAPENSIITQPIGSNEVWVIDTSTNFHVQVIKSIAITNNVQYLKNVELEIVKTTEGFAKIIKEEKNGFIFEEKFGNTLYDFRYFLVQGDNQYIFSKTLTAELTLEEIKHMYEIVQ